MSLPPSTLNKPTLRKALLDRRLSIANSERQRKDAAIAAHIEHYLAAHPVQTLGVFWPIRNEPDLIDLYRRLSQESVTLSLPVVTAPAKPLRFAAWTPGDPMSKDAYGVPAPTNLLFVDMPQALLVPCVGYNSSRFRIGYGGGFYDRTLAQQPKPFSIGIAYSCQLAEFEVGDHDIPLDLIVTEIAY